MSKDSQVKTDPEHNKMLQCQMVASLRYCTLRFKIKYSKNLEKTKNNYFYFDSLSPRFILALKTIAVFKFKYV